MNCTDFSLNPQREPRDWQDLQSSKFVCSDCLQTLSGSDGKMFYFPQLDYVFHQHSNGKYYRALRLLKHESGEVIRLGFGDGDGEKMNWLRCTPIILDGLGAYQEVNHFQELSLEKKHEKMKFAFKEFFDEMRKQGRKFEK